MARNYAALLHEYRGEMAALSDAEFGRLCRALLDYSADGTTIALSGNERFYAARVMMQEDRFQKSYSELIETRRDAGKKGAEARASKAKQSLAQLSSAKQSLAQLSKTTYIETKTETETKTNTETEINKDRLNKRESKGEKNASRFTPPQVEEVKQYCAERENGIDAETFIDYYTARGWKIGNQPMKDWKAAVRTWERRNFKDTHKEEVHYDTSDPLPY